MNKYFNDKEHTYAAIVEILRIYKGLTKDEVFQILKDKDCRYLFFLLIKKYRCFDLKLLKRDLPSINKNKLQNNIKKAEEKLLFNKKIRNMYFEAEDLMDKIK
ncbi:ribose-5-phosphate isomerase [Clostridium sp. LBM24168]